MDDRKAERLDSFDEHLIEYDEALGAGATPAPADETPEGFDPALARRLERAKHCLQLIERVKHQQPDSLAEVADNALGNITRADFQDAPQTIGRFQIIRELGRGGYGVVLLAVDPHLDRQVALKIPRPEVVLSAELLRRFLREGKAVATLNHANVLPVFEVGHVGALCYVASAYCAGGSLADWLKNRHEPVPARLAAQLVRSLAEGVQHAHERGVVHRDLKPANVLIAGGGARTPDGQDLEPAVLPGAQAPIPMITDFGLAKTSADGEETRTGAVIGTPAYLAPEQARGSKDVGPAADVHALGAILYEMLTGGPPFRRESDVATLRAVELNEPFPPRRLRKELPRDLEAICLKCLQKQPARRYESAAALADDLRRFLDGEPIRARRAGSLERARRWAQRRPAQAAAALMTIITLVALSGLGVYWWNYRQTEQANAALDRLNNGLKDANVKLDASSTKVKMTSNQLRQANAKLAASNQKLEETGKKLQDANKVLTQFRYANLIELADRAIKDERPDVAKPLLAACPPQARHWEWHHLNRLAGTYKGTLTGHEDSIRAVAFTPDGRLLVSAAHDGAIKLWDWPSGAEVVTLKGSGSRLQSAALSRDGSRLVTVTQRQGNKISLKLTLWDLKRREVLRTITQLGQIAQVAFSPDGTQLVASGADGVRVYDLASSQVRFQTPKGRRTLPCFSIDMRRFAFGHNDYVEIWDAQTAKKLQSWQAHALQVSCVLYSPDGKWIATGSYDRTVKLWSAATGRLRATLSDHQLPILCLAFSPDSRRLVSSAGYLGKPAEIRIWDLRLPQSPIVSFSGAGRIFNVAFSRDGKFVVGGCVDGSIRIWKATPQHAARRFTPAGPFVTFFPDGKRIASVDDRGCIRAHDVATRAPLGSIETGMSNATGITISPDGKHVAVTCSRGEQKVGAKRSPRSDVVAVWNVETLLGGKCTEPVFIPASIRAQATHAASFSPDSKELAVASEGGLTLWNLEQGQKNARVRLLGKQRATALGVDFSPDGGRIAAGYKDSSVRIWNTTTGQLVHTLAGHARPVLAVAYSPDGQRVASGGADATIRVWEAATGEHTMTLQGHRAEIRAVVFSPDGRRLFSCADDFTIRVWDLVTGQEILTIRAPARFLSSLAISPDGRRLVCGTPNGLYVWDP